MIEALLQVILPAFFVIGVGCYLGYVFKPDITSINRLALYAAVPSLVFVSLSNTEVAFQDVGVLLSGNILFLIAMAIFVWLTSQRFSHTSRRGLLATSLFSNSANIMLPVTLFAFGEIALQRALILYVFSALVLFTLGPVVLSSANERAAVSNQRFFLSILRLPVVWAAFFGVMFNVFSIDIPIGLARGIGILGDAAIPLVLVTLGFQIQRAGFKLPDLVNISGASFKLIIGPLVGFITARLVGAQGIDLAVLTLLAAMPPAVNNFMLALEFGGNAEEIARTVILSTFTSLFSLAIVVTILRTVVA